MLFNKNAGGFIAYFNLEDWWQNTLTPDDRKVIINLLPNGNFRDLSINRENLNKGKIVSISITDIFFLSSLLSYIPLEMDELRAKFLDHIESYPKTNENIIDFHFVYSNLIHTYYKRREDPTFLQKTIQSCLKQIDLSDKASKAFLRTYPNSNLPTHVGYKQLAIILEKKHEYAKVVELCGKAKIQGWTGDWDKRIEKCSK